MIYYWQIVSHNFNIQYQWKDPKNTTNFCLISPLCARVQKQSCYLAATYPWRGRFLTAKCLTLWGLIACACYQEAGTYLITILILQTDGLLLSYSARLIYGIFPCMLGCHLWKTQKKEVAIKSISVNSTLQGSGKTWA